MSNTFFTSDNHFGSEVTFKNTPTRYRFGSVDKIDAEMIDNWNKVVGHGDVVHHLGDFCSWETPVDKQKDYINALNGTIYLIRGNHDMLSEEDYINIGIKRFNDTPLILKSLVNQHPSLWLCHYPVQRNLNYYTLTGHIHEKWRVARRMLNVGVDANNFTPLSLDEVMVAMNKEAVGVWDANVYPDAPFDWREKVSRQNKAHSNDPTVKLLKLEEYNKRASDLGDRRDSYGLEQLDREFAQYLED